ncbi:hypothetical protein P3T43_007178, partial [Paraburkholderia sp. GAS41]
MLSRAFDTVQVLGSPYQRKYTEIRFHPRLASDAPVLNNDLRYAEVRRLAGFAVIEVTPEPDNIPTSTLRTNRRGRRATPYRLYRLTFKSPRCPEDT